MDPRDLFEPTRIGSLEVPNHFIRSATYEGKATEEGAPTEVVARLYRDFAEGGVGTIVTSFAYVAPYEQPEKRQLGIYKDELVDSYRPLVEAAHGAGARIVMQIVHGSSLSQGYPDRARVLGPSAVENPASGITPEEMDREDMRAVARLFAQAARRAKKAGFDGVQVHCAHGYLLSQFTSPLFNRRNDEYGGSPEGRVRFVREVCAAVRDEVGPDFPVWIKMNSTDGREGGLTVDEFLVMAQLLAADGIDAIEVSGEGWNRRGRDERAYFAEAAERLADLVDAPVILTGGLRGMEDIAPVCERSRVGLFGFARPLIRDHAFVQTLRGQLS